MACNKTAASDKPLLKQNCDQKGKHMKKKTGIFCQGKS